MEYGVGIVGACWRGTGEGSLIGSGDGALGEGGSSGTGGILGTRPLGSRPGEEARELPIDGGGRGALKLRVPDGRRRS